MNGKDTQCACCGYYTLEEGSIFDICRVCFWQDDVAQNDNPDSCCGANRISLKEAQANYKQYGVGELQDIAFVRKPKKEDMGQDINTTF